MKKAVTLEEQLKKVVADIETTKAHLKKLKKAKKELEEKINMKQLQDLQQRISSKGKSIEEVIEFLDRINDK